MSKQFSLYVVIPAMQWKDYENFIETVSMDYATKPHQPVINLPSTQAHLVDSFSSVAEWPISHDVHIAEAKSQSQASSGNQLFVNSEKCDNPSPSPTMTNQCTPSKHNYQASISVSSVITISPPRKKVVHCLVPSPDHNKVIEALACGGTADMDVKKARERAEAERAEREAEEKKACEEEEKREAECKCKARAGKGDEAGTSGEAGGEVKQVVMDPGCTHCACAQVVCEFVVDSNKKHIACVRCNQSKGKCQWPGDGKDTEASPKIKADKGKKRKADEETPEPGPSQKKQAKTSVRPIEVLDLNETEASGSGVKEARLIANNLASLFELHKTTVENSGCIADALELLLDESYGYRMAVSPSDSGSSELDSDELRKEAEWLKNHGEDEEGEAEGEDEDMAE
ncbi:hypothetical protein M404DRAFT_29459 [Pisolithus tinctorius Marx 270]|uniref:Uncharacterized protein n=1 Tax=Pisolithus tinctorius Marx 270 TaxID=870435 RepID=A0A0C3NZ16_PISTI|nr:hypothetical protein M404DRAFT_29459 [Pisolithus tinctorius Marx 270]